MTAPRLWVGTSWKMNKTVPEALAYVDELAAADLPDSIQAFILPPLTALAAVRDRLPADSRVIVGAQNAHWAPEGAFTGEVSMRMVADAGARLLEMGHSERRATFGETDDIISRKARAAVDAGMTPLICVGETDVERADGVTVDIVTRQVAAAVSRLTEDETAGVIVAYEPVWAIGEHGREPEPGETDPVFAVLHEQLAGLTGGRGCRALLYGGSVNPGNAVGLLDEPHTDGLFVGRSAWTAAGLLRLIAMAAAHPRATSPA